MGEGRTKSVHQVQIKGAKHALRQQMQGVIMLSRPSVMPKASAFSSTAQQTSVDSGKENPHRVDCKENIELSNRIHLESSQEILESAPV